MTTLFLARCCSSLLGIFPFIILVYVLITRAGLSHQQFVIMMPLLFFLTIGIPFGYVIIAFMRKKITDLDLTNRKERIIPFLITLACSIASLIAIHFMGNEFLFKSYLLLLILTGVNAAITVFWKISLHMAANITFVILINDVANWRFPWLFILIPIIYWSRLKLKKHTHMQLVVSFFLNAGIIWYYTHYTKLFGQ